MEKAFYCAKFVLLRLILCHIRLDIYLTSGTSIRPLKHTTPENILSGGYDDESNVTQVNNGTSVYVTVCQHGCVCTAVKYRILTCDKANTLVRLKFDKPLDNITELIVENQPGLTHLSAEDLELFSSLTKLTIRHCGLTYMLGDTFQHNPHLDYLDLRSNNLQTLSYKVMDSVYIEDIYLQNNSFTCNCSMYWIQRMMLVDEMRYKLGHDLNHIRCLDYKPVRDVAFHSDTCSPATAVISPVGSVTVEAGDDVNITCHGTGIPPPRVYWNDTGLVADVTITSSDGALKQTLSLRNVSPYDNGWIECLVENEATRDRVIVSLGVRAAPIIVDLHIVQEDVIFHCIEYVLISNPAPNITWYQNGGLLSDKHTSIEHNPRVKSQHTPKGTGRSYVQGCLTFKTLLLLNNAVYTLVATNEYGSVNRSIRYEQEWPPDMHNLSPDDGPSRLGRLPEKPFTKWPIKEMTTSSPIEDDGDITIYTWVGAIVVTCAILFPLTIFLYRRYRGPFRKHRLASSKGRDGNHRGRENLPLTSSQMLENPNYSVQEETPLSYIEIRHIRAEFISCLEQLGEGAFGRVYLGRCDNMPKEGEHVMVAIKMLKDASDDIKKEFEREAEVLSNIEHPNIVTFYGICIEQENYMMIFEYMEHGDLNNYLRTHGPDAAVFSKTVPLEPSLSELQLLHIIHQISNGMMYLALQHLVHRDLATRNCLVGPGLLIKIGDFGMSRDVYSTDYYKVGGSALLPVRWIPPESLLYRTFTVESDIWSFGVVMWEVLTYGRQPWYQLSNTEVIQCITNGHLLDIPTNCPEELSKIMMGCWKRQPHERMSMKVIFNHLERLCLTYPGYVNLLT